MNINLILAIGFLLLALVFFISATFTVRKFYMEREDALAYKHWMGQIAHLMKNWEPRYLIVVVLLVSFLVCYVLGMIWFKKLASG